ncbi:14876_t:CDS:2 [Gigaspora margarita]|uniref:14876_t:CDS:1 n=1 Tax=Gigaspora margarita TaxID=4874 RepID=A0ABN7VN23_GIGMA|nr:14876_t:CDS:2 [Gigaspora margarita]
MSSKNKVTLTNKQKREIIEFKNQNPNTSYVELVQWIKKEYNLEVHPSTISHLIKNKEDVLRSQEKIPITDTILVKKRRTFANILNIPDNSLKFSNEEDKKLNVLGAIQFVVHAWNEVSPTTIYNCFYHTRILPNCTEEIAIAIVVEDKNALIHELDEDIGALCL